MWYVYLLSNHEDRYIGYTNNIERRLKEHNSRRNKSTKNASWKIVYFEAYLSQEDAIQREKRLKQHGRAKQELFKRCTESLKNISRSGAG